jgi:hypothetical protein
MLTTEIHNWQDLAALAEEFAIDRHRWIFRGVLSEHYALIPKVGRSRARLDRYGDPAGYSPDAEQAAIIRFQSA